LSLSVASKLHLLVYTAFLLSQRRFIMEDALAAKLIAYAVASSFYTCNHDFDTKLTLFYVVLLSGEYHTKVFLGPASS